MTEEQFILNIGIRPSPNQGIEQTVRQMQLIDKWCQAMGMSADEAQKHLDALLKKSVFNNKFRDTTGNLTDLGKAVVSQYTQEKERHDQEERYRADRRNTRNAQLYSGLANPFSFFSPKSGLQVQTLLNNIGRVVPKMQAFAVSFQSAKGVWDFATAIADLNKQILRLSYTSGLGAQKLTDLGAAVAAYGGSAASLASANERFIMQIESMKRGGGLGYLGEVAYKYGFNVDLDADWETNKEAAIKHARRMIASGDENGAKAFLKTIDSANYESNLIRAHKSESEDAEYQSFFTGYDQLGDAEQITEETQKFAEESAKAQRAWTAITNQMASMLLPLMTQLTSFVTKIADYIAKSPGLLVAILTVLGTIMGVVTALIAKQMWLTTLKIAGAVASGNWAGAAAAGAIIGLGVIGAASMTSIVNGSGPKQQKIEDVASDAISVKDIVSADKSLTARERYSLSEQEKAAFGSAQTPEFESHKTPEWDNSLLVGSSNTLAEVFNKVMIAADNMKDSMADVAKEAMSMEEAAKYATLVSTANNISNRIDNTSNTSNVNVNIAQNFNEADTSEIRNGTFDVVSEIEKQLSQASRRFNT